MNGINIVICYLLVAVFVVGTSYVVKVVFKEVCGDCAVYVKRALAVMRRKRFASCPLLVKCSFATAVFAGVVAKVIKSQL